MMLKALCKQNLNRVTFLKTDDDYCMISYCKKILKIQLSNKLPYEVLVSLVSLESKPSPAFLDGKK